MNLHDLRLQARRARRLDLHRANCICLVVFSAAISWLAPGGMQAADDATLDSSHSDASANAGHALDLAGDPLPAGAAVRLGTVRFHFEGALASLAVSPDGAILAGGGASATVILWDATTGQVLRRINRRGSCRSLTFSPDGRWLAIAGKSGGNDAALELVEVANGDTGPQFVFNDQAEIGVVAFSPDGALIATGGFDRTVRLFNAINAQELNVLKSPVVIGQREVICLAFSPDGKWLAAGSDAGEASIWDLGAANEPLKLEVISHFVGRRNGVVDSLAFSPDSRRLLASGSEYDPLVHGLVGHIRSFDPVTGAAQELALDDYQALPGTVKLVCSADHRILAAVHFDQTEVWDFASGKKMTTIEKNVKYDFTGPPATAFSPGGQMLFAPSNQVVRRWKTETGKEIQDLPASHVASVEKLTFSADGKRVATTASDRTTRAWDATTGRPLLEVAGMMAAMSPDGEVAAIDHSWKHITPESSVRLVSMASGQEVARLDTDGPWLGPGSFSHDGKLLAVASYDHGDDLNTYSNQNIYVWQVAKQSLRVRLLADDPLLRTLQFSDDDQKLYGVSKDATLAVWNMTTGKQDFAVPTKADGARLSCAVFSQRGGLVGQALILSVPGASLTARVGVWDIARRKTVLASPMAPVVGPQHVALSPNGRLLAVADSWPHKLAEPRDAAVRFWDVVRGVEIARMPTGGASVVCLEFSPNGKRLAGGCADGTALIWNREMHEGIDDDR